MMVVTRIVTSWVVGVLRSVDRISVQGGANFGKAIVHTCTVCEAIIRASRSKYWERLSGILFKQLTHYELFACAKRVHI